MAPLVYSFNGNKELARAYIGEAQRKLFALKQGKELGKLGQAHSPVYHYPDGTTIRISSVYGNDKVWITSPFGGAFKGKGEAQFIALYVTTMEDRIALLRSYEPSTLAVIWVQSFGYANLRVAGEVSGVYALKSRLGGSGTLYKFSHGGKLLWSLNCSSIGDFWLVANDIGVFVLTQFSLQPGYGIKITGYDKNGKEILSYTVGSGDPAGFAADKRYLYVWTNDGGSETINLVKYDPVDKELKWTVNQSPISGVYLYYYDSYIPGYSPKRGGLVATDTAVYAYGYTLDPEYFPYRQFIAAYSAKTGALIWAKNYNVDNNTYDNHFICSVDIAQDGNLYAFDTYSSGMDTFGNALLTPPHAYMRIDKNNGGNTLLGEQIAWADNPLHLRIVGDKVLLGYCKYQISNAYPALTHWVMSLHNKDNGQVIKTISSSDEPWPGQYIMDMAVIKTEE